MVVAACRCAAVPHEQFTAERQAQFERDGFVSLGNLLSTQELGALSARLDQLMLGEVSHGGMSFQLDGGPGGVASLQGGGNFSRMCPVTVGLHRRTLDHRRVNDLERDPLFRRFIEKDVFRAITALYYPGSDVAIFRAFMMNKPAHKGTPLGWHQDMGAGWGINTTPSITTWTALDDVTPESGPMQLVRGSHARGVLNDGHFADADTMAQFSSDSFHSLTCRAGETILLHNLVLHSSGVNASHNPRRALSVAYIAAESRYLHDRDSRDAFGGDARPHGASAASELEGSVFPMIFRRSRGTGRCEAKL
jgi:phytanoyl-CoA hydroxylase